MISMATTISPAESTVGTTATDSCGLSGLSSRVRFIGRLLGSGKISQCDLRLVRQVLGMVNGMSRPITTVMCGGVRSRLGSLFFKKGERDYDSSSSIDSLN